MLPYVMAGGIARAVGWLSNTQRIMDDQDRSGNRHRSRYYRADIGEALEARQWKISYSSTGGPAPPHLYLLEFCAVRIVAFNAPFGNFFIGCNWLETVYSGSRN